MGDLISSGYEPHTSRTRSKRLTTYLCYLASWNNLYQIKFDTHNFPAPSALKVHVNWQVCLCVFKQALDEMPPVPPLFVVGQVAGCTVVA